MRWYIKINPFSSIRAAIQIAWLLYFATTLVIIGLILAYGVVAPLYLIGRFYSPANKVADIVMRWGIGVLMSVQPWFNADIHFPAIPSGGLLLVSNHRSHLDAFILLSQVRGIKILARRSLFSIPGIGAIMAVSRQIPVYERGVDSYLLAMEIVRQRLRNGETVHVFPEMTRCPKGFSGTKDFSTMPFHIARQEGIPILPIVFKGTDEVWPRGQIGLNFRRPVYGAMLETVEPSEFESAQELKCEVQRRIGVALQ